VAWERTAATGAMQRKCKLGGLEAVKAEERKEREGAATISLAGNREKAGNAALVPALPCAPPSPPGLWLA